MTPEDRVMLGKLMMMTTSTHDGEALNALRAANRILARHKLSWREVLEGTRPNVVRGFRPAAKSAEEAAAEAVNAMWEAHKEAIRRQAEESQLKEEQRRERMRREAQQRYSKPPRTDNSRQQFEAADFGTSPDYSTWYFVDADGYKMFGEPIADMSFSRFVDIVGLCRSRNIDSTEFERAWRQKNGFAV